MPENHESSLSGALKRPFPQQVAFFRGKLGRLVPTRRWDDIKEAEHDRAFMVAGAVQADLLTDLAAAVDRSITEGQSLDAFRKDFRAIVQKNGWHGWTGEGTRAGEAWRTRTIYRTNASTSYAAGRFAQLVEGDFPFWVYLHGGSKEPRINHLSFNGLVLPPAHPFWLRFYPPSDWGCSCYVVGARSLRAARRLGGDPDKQLPQGWDKPDPKTGRLPGLGKGWGYAPGASVASTVNALAEKAVRWDHRIAKGFMETVPEAQRDALARAYRNLPSVADDARRYAQRIFDPAPGPVETPAVRTLGLATSDQVAAINALQDVADISLFDYVMEPPRIVHIFNRHGPPSKESLKLSADDFALLPQLLNAPDTIEYGKEQIDPDAPVITMRKRIGGLEYEAVWVIQKGRRSLSLKTFYIVRKVRAAPADLTS